MLCFLLPLRPYAYAHCYWRLVFKIFGTFDFVRLFALRMLPYVCHLSHISHLTSDLSTVRQFEKLVPSVRQICKIMLPSLRHVYLRDACLRRAEPEP